MLDKGRAHITINLFGKLIAIIEASAERLYLIAIAGQPDNIFSAIVLEVEHEMLLFAVKSYTHSSSLYVYKAFFFKYNGAMR